MIDSQPLPLPQRRPRPLRWQPLAGAGTLAALLIAGALFFPGSPGRPTVAFADVQRAMQKLKAVSWTQTQIRYDLHGGVMLHNTQRFWVRRDPPAVAEQDSASSVPQIPGGEYAGPARQLTDAYGYINLHTQDGVYYIHPAPQNIAREVSGTIDSLTASAAPGTPWKMERTTFAGRAVLVFRSHIHTQTDAGEPGRRAIDGDDTLWADPDTLRVIRHQSDIVWGPFRAVTDGGKTRDLPAERIVLDTAGFQYDQPVPAGVFTLTPPPGARVTEDDGRGNKTVIVGHPR